MKNKRDKKEMKKNKKFLYFTILAVLILGILYIFLETKLALIIACCLWLFGSYIIMKEKIGQELVVAFLFAIAWTSYNFYEYINSNIFIGGKINLYPLICWTGGLVLLREIYERLDKSYKFLKIYFIYLVGLFFLEYIGYHFLNIQLNSNFPSLFNLGIIHTPLVAKVFYLIAGPAYLLITNYLKVK
jgi:hypothetical protein